MMFLPSVLDICVIALAAFGVLTLIAIIASGCWHGLSRVVRAYRRQAKKAAAITEPEPEPEEEPYNIVGGYVMPTLEDILCCDSAANPHYPDGWRFWVGQDEITVYRKGMVLFNDHHVGVNEDYTSFIVAHLEERFAREKEQERRTGLSRLTRVDE